MTQTAALRPAELRAATLLNGLIPGGLLIGYAVRGELGANPVEFLLRATGTLAMVFLLLTLAVTPLRRLTGAQVVGKLRRMLGLLCFGYASAHVLVYAVAEQALSLAAIAEDVISRPFVAVGFAGYAFLIPLAVTSTAGWVRRLGGARWTRLHRRIYGIALLALVHDVWLVKADATQPLLYGAILAALLGLRLLLAARSRPVKKDP